MSPDRRVPAARAVVPTITHETVGEHLEDGFITGHVDSRVGDVIDRLAAAGRPTELACAVDGAGSLVGCLPVTALLSLPASRTLGEVVDRGYPRAHPRDDQEHAASLALHHDVAALPVVDAAGRPIGVLPPRALLHILRREHVEDLHRLAGIQRESARARHAIEDPPLRRYRHRLPWLVIGLLGSAVATAVMASFEARIASHVAIAFFVPAIVYLADAVGTQSEAIAVRGLSLSRAGIARLVAGELRVGTLIGATLGALAVPAVLAGFGDLRLALAVGAAIWAASSIAATLGLALPWILSRAGADPAHGSGPMATVIQDVLSLLVYFAVVRAFGV